MAEGQMQVKVDKTNLIKAGAVPIIVAVVGGLLWLIASLRGIPGILMWALAVFAGIWYADRVSKAGAKPAILDVVVNGAILGAVVGLVYGIVSWIAISIHYHGLGELMFRWDIGAVLLMLLEGAIGGGIGAAVLYAFKSGMIKTK
jgi:hypothetical protein